MLDTWRKSPRSAKTTFPLPRWGWIHGFMLLQFILQVLLLFPLGGAVRMPMRVAAFALSLGLLLRLRGSGLKHPAKPWAIAILMIMAFSLFWHPYLSSFTAGVAQYAIYLAILAPLFWATKLPLTVDSFRWLVFLLWGFHSFSSVIGVLQVYYPQLFQFEISDFIETSTFAGEQFKIILANGQSIYRPTGLSDIPGAAANSGFYALLLGTGIALQERNLLLRLISISTIATGMFCIYVSQVRSVLIYGLICLIILAGVLLLQGKWARLSAMLGGVTMLAMTTLALALQVGGGSTSDRLSSLIADRPDTIIYNNRGLFLEDTLTNLLPEYPLGAGLGRWGMINGYFGDQSNPLTQPLWAEIQWTGWLYDGGVPLMTAYAGALLLACYAAWKIAVNPKMEALQIWAGIVLAYDVGAIAITFNYPLFNSQGGMEFWLINATLFVAAHSLKQRRIILEPWMLQ
jgi:hypothetical protein